MTPENYATEFRLKARTRGYSEDVIEKFIKYATRLIGKKLPVIFNLSNLSTLVGYSTIYIERVCKHKLRHYRRFYIPKKNSPDKRMIREPLTSLKEIQIWILKNILEKVSISDFAKAYHKKRGIKDNIKYHRAQPIVLSLDIVDFFGQIRIDYIYRIFKGLGYNDSVSSYLSELVTLNDVLPQGAPTSPYLSNIYMKQFDLIVSDFCKENKIRYTRYADDLTFSGDFDYNRLIIFIETQLGYLNLRLNKSKTKVMKQYQQQVVTGIVVNNKFQVPRNKRMELRQAVYYINKYGLEHHLERTKVDKEGYLSNLIGTAKYMLYINPKDEKIKEYLSFLTSMQKGL